MDHSNAHVLNDLNVHLLRHLFLKRPSLEWEACIIIFTITVAVVRAMTEDITVDMEKGMVMAEGMVMAKGMDIAKAGTTDMVVVKMMIMMTMIGEM